MKYDFDQVILRKDTDCAKWDAAEALFGDDDIIPMWVADMDFPIAKPITEALRKRTEHEIYGYSLPAPDSTIEAIINRMSRKYDWDIKPEWIIFTPGVVPALFAAVKAFTRPGDSVLHQGPVYYPFWSAIEENGCHVANNQLKLVNGRYEIDFKDLADRFKPKVGLRPAASRVRMMIMCNPHNPVGRVWNRNELKRMGEIVLKHHAIMVADEIHGELVLNGATHIPFASISEDFQHCSVTCLAPSKTFNLAGLGASVIIIPDKDLRQKFKLAKNGIMPRVNVFGLVALEAAFNQGDEWLEQLLKYLQQNLEYLKNFFSEYIPGIKVIEPEGTYLIWLDCRELGMDTQSLRTFMRKKAKVGLDDGFLFGPSGEGFQRINIACPRATLTEALTRIKNAVMAKQ